MAWGVGQARRQTAVSAVHATLAGSALSVKYACQGRSGDYIPVRNGIYDYYSGWANVMERASGLPVRNGIDDCSGWANVMERATNIGLEQR